MVAIFDNSDFAICGYQAQRHLYEARYWPEAAAKADPTFLKALDDVLTGGVSPEVVVKLSHHAPEIDRVAHVLRNAAGNTREHHLAAAAGAVAKEATGHADSFERALKGLLSLASRFAVSYDTWVQIILAVVLFVYVEREGSVNRAGDAAERSAWQQEVRGALSSVEKRAARRHVNSRANLRMGPGRQYAVVEVLPEGTRINVEERQGKWLRVRIEASGTTGWVDGLYVCE